MDDILKQILVIGNVQTRLSALAEHRGTPDNVRTQLQTEAASLGWAYQELHQKYISHVKIVIGDYEYIKTIDGIPQQFIHIASGLADVVLIEPDEIMYGKVKSFLFSSVPQPNKPKFEKTLPQLQCDACFASYDEHDKNKRVMLFECQASKPWLNGLGYNAARISLAAWAAGVFRAAKWQHSQEETQNE
jgi:hypothetical protein